MSSNPSDVSPLIHVTENSTLTKFFPYISKPRSSWWRVELIITALCSWHISHPSTLWSMKCHPSPTTVLLLSASSGHSSVAHADFCPWILQHIDTPALCVFMAYFVEGVRALEPFLFPRVRMHCIFSSIHLVLGPPTSLPNSHILFTLIFISLKALLAHWVNLCPILVYEAALHGHWHWLNLPNGGQEQEAEKDTLHAVFYSSSLYLFPDPRIWWEAHFFMVLSSTRMFFCSSSFTGLQSPHSIS